MTPARNSLDALTSFFSASPLGLGGVVHGAGGDEGGLLALGHGEEGHLDVIELLEGEIVIDRLVRLAGEADVDIGAHVGGHEGVALLDKLG